MCSDLNDFDNTTIIITFEPDEDVVPMNGININGLGAPVPIVDDAVNEAEQVFVVELRLVSSINPATVDLSIQPTSLCRIVDNDRKCIIKHAVRRECDNNYYPALAIRIGFEQSSYFYTEPLFETEINESFVSLTSFAERPIYLAKEDNVTSEQTFLVAIQVGYSALIGINAPPASLGNDYRLIETGPSVVIPFFPTESRIVFRFILLADMLAEGNEIFMASLSAQLSYELPGGSYYATFNNPINLSSETSIIIEDDDREFLL